MVYRSGSGRVRGTGGNLMKQCECGRYFIAKQKKDKCCLCHLEDARRLANEFQNLADNARDSDNYSEERLYIYKCKLILWSIGDLKDKPEPLVL